jgi:DNA-binding transcriptional ArsR family regulator
MQSDARDYDIRFSLLSDQNRRGVLSILAKGPSTVTQLSDSLGIRRQLVSHHLAMLKMGRLVSGTRKGRSVTYVANRETLKELSACLAGLTPKR